MDKTVITFVYGWNHYEATKYIREAERKGENVQSYRNITNVNSLKGLRSTENTTIRFVWLGNCYLNKSYPIFKQEMQARQLCGANIEEIGA